MEIEKNKHNNNSLDREPLTTNPVIDSQDLFGNKKMIMIQHRGNLYRLMITSQGKLILTK